MKYESLLQEIDERIMKNRVARNFTIAHSTVNDDLRENNNLLGKIKTVLKSAGNDYERGCEDVWEMIKKISLSSKHEGYSLETCKDIFDYAFFTDILRNCSVQEVLEKYKTYEQKKKEEAEKLVIGDVVEVRYVTSSNAKKGILIGENCSHYSVKFNEYDITQTLSKQNYILKKTGKHFDIQGMLDELKEE